MLVYTLGSRIRVDEDNSFSSISSSRIPPFRSSITAKELLAALPNQDTYVVFLKKEDALHQTCQQAQFETYSDFGEIVFAVNAIFVLDVSPTAIVEKDDKTYSIAKKDINEILAGTLIASDLTDPLMPPLREGILALEVNLQDPIVQKYKAIFDNPIREKESSFSSSINASIDVADVLIPGIKQKIPASIKKADETLVAQQKETKSLIGMNKQFIENAATEYQSGWWCNSRDKNEAVVHLLNSRATLFSVVALLETQKSNDNEYNGLINAVKSKLSEDRNLAVAISEETDMVTDVANIVISYLKRS